MATVKGIWFFNGTITRIPTEETVDFSVIRADGSVTNYIGMLLYNMYLSYEPNAYQVHNAYLYGNSSWVEECFRTVDFGTTEQTVSDDFYTWLTANAVQQSSDPSEPTTDTLYTVNGFSLTAVANAIRGKTGTTGELAFPDGYVSAVNDISSVSDLSNAKDIAFGGNESGGKYVIEDETITPLFKQVQRVAEVADPMTFAKATESLLNVTPGGGLPSAEEASFGIASGFEYGISNMNVYADNTFTYTSGLEFTAAETFSVVGFRLYRSKASQNPLSGIRLWDANGNLRAETENSFSTVGAWESVLLDTPVNVAIGETFIAGIYMRGYALANNQSFNAKLKNANGVYNSGNGMPNKDGGGVLFGVVDIIIGSVQTDLPDSYEIQRTTMDDIANEVKRITGAEGKISTAQILTALQGM